MSINTFQGDYSFLSNFWECDVPFEGDIYPTSEHAYQAAKTLVQGERLWIRFMETPGKAKRAGQEVTMQEGWDDRKVSVMHSIVLSKFQNNPDLRLRLLDTGQQDLIEGNTWDDTFWGVCKGKGQNKLGKILMQVRAELRRNIKLENNSSANF